MFKAFYCRLVLGFVLSFGLFDGLSAQGPGIHWSKTFGGVDDDYGYSVQQTSDGGYIIAGCTSSSGAGEDDFWLLKTDEFGDTLWSKTYGKSSYDYCYTVQQTTDGGYILVGETHSISSNKWDAWLLKTDSLGDTLWTKTFSGGDHDFGRSVRQVADGGYIITGRTSSFGSGNEDLWLIKTDTLGDTLWTKTFGGSADEQGCSIQQTSDGGYVIVGLTESFGAGNHDVWLLKTDTLGDTLWTKTFGGSDSEFGWSVRQTIDGGYIIAGRTRSFGQGNHDAWLIKTDSLGDTLWTRTFGGSGIDGGRCVRQTADEGYIITGMTDSFGSGRYDVWLIKTDTSGDTVWTRTFGESNGDLGHSVQQTSDGGYIVTGYTASFGAGGYDLWLIKTGPATGTSEDGNRSNVAGNRLLKQNHPNPFETTTRIPFSLPHSCYATVTVYDMLGREVKTLVSGFKRAGRYSVAFDGTQLPSGFYSYELRIGNNTAETRKMVLLRNE